jgi:hypothetical protein
MMTTMARPVGELNNSLVHFRYIQEMYVHYFNGEASGEFRISSLSVRFGYLTRLG